MKHNHLSKINKPIIALSASFSDSVVSSNWIDFMGYSEFLVDVIGKVSDGSISPNRSTILRSLFDIVNYVSVMLLEKGEYFQFSEFSETVINRYYGRFRENEIGDAVSYLAGDMVVSNYIKAIYDETRKLAIASSDDIYQRFKQLDCLKKLHYLFFINGNTWAFQQIVSTHFSAIADNATINNVQKDQILRESVKEFFRMTERDLNVILKTPFNLAREQVLDSYIYDWTSILRQFYDNIDKSMIESVFSYISSPTIGNELIESYLYPCLAINLIMIEVTNSQLDGGDKGSLFSFDIKGKHNTYNGICNYVSSQQHLRNRDLLRFSYLSMVKLVEVWKQRSNRLTTFDYSPEIFLILVCSFMYEPVHYQDILKWTVVDRLPRCDRFPEIIDDFKKSVSSYPANDPNSRIGKTLTSFADAFESTRYRLENDRSELNTNLDKLKSEALSLLSTI